VPFSLSISVVIQDLAQVALRATVQQLMHSIICNTSSIDLSTVLKQIGSWTIINVEALLVVYTGFILACVVRVKNENGRKFVCKK